MLPLLGVAVVVLGFAARVNPLLVVMSAAIVSGLAGGLDLPGIISAFGKAFNENRYVSVTWLVLPVIGALERAGLQERARDLIVGIRAASVFSMSVCCFWRCSISNARRARSSAKAFSALAKIASPSWERGPNCRPTLRPRG